MGELVLLVGAPASGKSSLAREWIASGRIDAGGVVSCDSVRGELFGDRVDVRDDPVVFEEMDRRVVARLQAGLVVVVDATNVVPGARGRMIGWARGLGCPVTALRFRVAVDVLLRRNAERFGPALVPAADVLRYAEAAERHAAVAQLLEEGVTLVVDVPGEAEGLDAAQAAAAVRLTRRTT